ncbi:hypothetical protein Lfu02_60350 [Longispora fulva]|uniref:Uncharacterized protein (DUF1697 family) n=1 Tax=Longispora fulva TaxID=619741 RepID=A0A8J7KJK7_9ACTN|nr:DUF1697 domain-containing protein [Longispora fulva]MBG6136984.1 uncharacterized protein (DUF1697 family) [Longispora fulva]GIG61663.1 hypothetical protein Lfu02_60350 [Longispora fulva]
MIRYVALLRGINVSGHNKIPMARLRDLLTGLGHTDVATLLQSGNAVFTSDNADPAAVGLELAGRITEELGLTIAVHIRTRQELSAVIAGNPLPAGPTLPKQFLVGFLNEEFDPARLDGLDPESYAPDEVRAVGRELYIWLPTGILETRLGPDFWQKRLRGTDCTTRNWSTVTKLLALADA